MNIDVLTDEQLTLLRETVGQAEKIVVCCHKSPDGDALGAVLAWSEYLRQQGKEPAMIVPDAFPDFLKWLPGNEMLIRYDKHKPIKLWPKLMWFSALILTDSIVWLRWNRQWKTSRGAMF